MSDHLFENLTNYVNSKIDEFGGMKNYLMKRKKMKEVYEEDNSKLKKKKKIKKEKKEESFEFSDSSFVSLSSD